MPPIPSRTYNGSTTMATFLFASISIILLNLANWKKTHKGGD
jgi:hypothetical protein